MIKIIVNYTISVHSSKVMDYIDEKHSIIFMFNDKTEITNKQIADKLFELHKKNPTIREMFIL